MTACAPTPSSTEQAAVTAEIAALNTEDKRAAYLDSLFMWDQEVRQSGGGADYGRRMASRDALNLLRVRAYLDRYGWPAGNAGIPTVLLHQSYAEQAVLFPVVYRAYAAGHYPADAFVFLLGRMHLNKFGEPFVPAGAHRPEVLVTRLIDRLGLEEESHSDHQLLD